MPGVKREVRFGESPESLEAIRTPFSPPSVYTKLLAVSIAPDPLELGGHPPGYTMIGNQITGGSPLEPDNESVMETPSQLEPGNNVENTPGGMLVSPSEDLVFNPSGGLALLRNEKPCLVPSLT